MGKKKLLSIIGIIGAIIVLFGTTYAFFIFYRVGDSKNQVITGEVYMFFEENVDTINILSGFPESDEEARSRTDNVINFTIRGKNTVVDQDVYYEIGLTYGDDVTGLTRIENEFLKFDLIETTNGMVDQVVSGKSFSTFGYNYNMKLSNYRKLWVNTFDRNTTNEIERTYQLRMWISDEIVISDTEDYADYKTDEFANTFANIKVVVYGDFNVKEMAYNPWCFDYNALNDSITYEYPELVLDTSEENVAICKNYEMSHADGTDYSDAQDGYDSFCRGTGTLSGIGWTLKDEVSYLYASEGEDAITELGVVKSYTFVSKYYNHDTHDEKVAICKDYMLESTDGTDYSDAQDGYQSFCEGTGTAFYYHINFNESFEDRLPYEVDYFVENGVLVETDEPNVSIEITDYDVARCGTDVWIPTTIEGYPVTRIADESSGKFYRMPAPTSNSFSIYDVNKLEWHSNNYKIEQIGNDVIYGVFAYYDLNSVHFPKTMEYIGENAFDNNNIKNVTIPKSVTTIVDNAFSDNPLVNVRVEGAPVLGNYSFYLSVAQQPGIFKRFEYGGTCEQLKNYYDNYEVFRRANLPTVIITSDNNNCIVQLPD